MLNTWSGVTCTMLKSFPRALKWSGGYKTGTTKFTICGMQLVAAKILIDRKSVIPAVTDLHSDGLSENGLRAALLLANKELERKWFIHLESPSKYTLNERAKAWMRMCWLPPSGDIERFWNSVMTPGPCKRALTSLLRTSFEVLSEKEQSKEWWLERFVRRRQNLLRIC